MVREGGHAAGGAGIDLLAAAMLNHATGSFEVRVQPLPSAPADGLMRMSIEKVIHGGLEATSKGEMLSAGNPKAGAAGYVAMEMVTGKLDGKNGSFALQHIGTLDASGQNLEVAVVPGSGTGELQGIAGRFAITIASGLHTYEFDYTLAEDN
jgi:hypothetical protein